VRLNINLASKPYLDIRRILLRWGGLVLLLAACTAGLGWKAYTNWRHASDVNARIAVLNGEIAALDRQHAEAMALLQAPQNAPVINTSKFLNGLIARKSFSWTHVFMQLEQIMPPRLHVVSISPELQQATNTVEVHLTVAGTSRDAAVDLVKRLEQSPSFREARIVEERAIQPQEMNSSVGRGMNRAVNSGTSDDTVQFHLMAVYIPQSGTAKIAQAAKTSEAKAAEPSAAGSHATPAKVAEVRGGAQ
jgi:type IV pilus assembly protein PilN